VGTADCRDPLGCAQGDGSDWCTVDPMSRKRGETWGTLVNRLSQICSGSSGSGSRTGASGFSGGEGGSLIGGGMGSAGVRRRKGGSGGAMKLLSRCMAFRCGSWARGSGVLSP